MAHIIDPFCLGRVKETVFGKSGYQHVDLATIEKVEIVAKVVSLIFISIGSILCFLSGIGAVSVNALGWGIFGMLAFEPDYIHIVTREVYHKGDDALELQKLDKMLGRGNIDLEYNTHDKSTFLCVAISRGKKELVKVLLKHGENPNAHGKDGKSPLEVFTIQYDPCDSKRSEIEILHMLLDSKMINPKVRFANGDTILHWAISNECEEIIEKLLIDRWSDLFNVQGFEKRTPLMVAICRNNDDIAEKLIEKIEDPNVSDQWGNTAFHYAAREGDQNLLEQMLEKWPDVIDARGFEGQTPLMQAYYYGEDGAADWLIAKGADRNLTDENKKTVDYYQQCSAID